MKIDNGRNIIPQQIGVIAISNDETNYDFTIEKSLVSSLDKNISGSRYIVVINLFGYSLVEVDLTTVTNQPSWTNNQAGVLQAISDINGWIEDNTITVNATASMPQILDTNNTKTITSADASPGSPWIGTPTRTRSVGVTGVLLTVISNVSLGGTYTFEFGEDGITFPVSISIQVDDFSTIRYRQLLNVGEFYRAKFEPSAPLGANMVFLTSQLATQIDTPFIVPAMHVYEEEDAAFGSTWSFIRAFNNSGLGEIIRSENGGLRISTAKVPSYRVAYRTAAAPNFVTIALTLVNPSIQMATIHHTALSTKVVQLKKCVFHLAEVSNAGNISVNLMRLTTAPTGGTVITAAKSDLNDPAPESICQILPTVAGTTSDVLYTFGLELASTDKNIEIDLLKELQILDIKPPILNAGLLQGYAIVVNSRDRTTLTGNIDITYTESLPNI